MYVKKDGKIKDTKVNRILALTYYGYSTKDISEILEASPGHIYETTRKYPVDQPLTRPVPLSMFKTKAEKELLKDYTRKINATYKRIQLEQQQEVTDTQEDSQTPEQVATNTGLGGSKPLKQVESKTKAVTNVDVKLITKGSLTFGDDEAEPVEDKVDERITKSQELVEEFHGDGEVRYKGYMDYLIAVDAELDEDGQCSLCSNKGWVMAPGETGIKKTICPVCLGNSTQKRVEKLDAYDKQQILEELIHNDIYRENNFDFEEFSKGILLPKELRGYTYDQYINFMNNVLNGLINRELPTKSYYIVAPDGYGKKWFAYEVIKLMVENNYKTTGLLDTVELSELLDSRKYTELKEKIDADIIMVTLTALNRGYYSHVIKYLTEYADSHGKALFVFSRVQAATLVAGDRGMAGVIFSHTGPHDYGRLMQVGLQGKEYTKAYQLLVDESNNSIGYDPNDKKANRYSRK